MREEAEFKDKYPDLKLSKGEPLISTPFLYMYTLNPFRLPLTKENSLAKIKLLLPEFISKGGLILKRFLISPLLLLRTKVNTLVLIFEGPGFVDKEGFALRR